MMAANQTLDGYQKPNQSKKPDFRRWVIVALTTYSILALVAIVWLVANGFSAPESLVLTLGTAVGGIAGHKASQSR